VKVLSTPVHVLGECDFLSGSTICGASERYAIFRYGAQARFPAAHIVKCIEFAQCSEPGVSYLIGHFAS
jgi:hypothetical protein